MKRKPVLSFFYYGAGDRSEAGGEAGRRDAEHRQGAAEGRRRAQGQGWGPFGGRGRDEEEDGDHERLRAQDVRDQGLRPNEPHVHEDVLLGCVSLEADHLSVQFQSRIKTSFYAVSRR